jgi:hypothetical protein
VAFGIGSLAQTVGPVVLEGGDLGNVHPRAACRERGAETLVEAPLLHQVAGAVVEPPGGLAFAGAPLRLQRLDQPVGFVVAVVGDDAANKFPDAPSTPAPSSSLLSSGLLAERCVRPDMMCTKERG